MTNEIFGKYARGYNKGDIVFAEFEPGDSLFFIQSGSVRVTKIIGDKEKCMAILTTGEIFGEMSILEQAPRSATAITEEPCKLLELTKENFVQLSKVKPIIAIKLFKSLASRILDQARKFKIISLGSPDLKIMDVFLMLVEKNNIHIADEVKNIRIEANPEVIANWAGISDDECQKHLKEMESKGQLKQFDGGFIINNVYSFQRSVNSKRQTMERESNE